MNIEPLISKELGDNSSDLKIPWLMYVSTISTIFIFTAFVNYTSSEPRRKLALSLFAKD